MYYLSSEGLAGQKILPDPKKARRAYKPRTDLRGQWQSRDK
jgi:hypothetical protein